MKLYRFIASDNQKAISKVHDTLGPDAMVYSTNRVEEGIEILAGLPHGLVTSKVDADEILIKDTMADQKVVEDLNQHLKTIDIHIQKLSSNINFLYQVMTGDTQKRKSKGIGFLNIFKNFRARKNLKEGMYGRQPAH